MEYETGPGRVALQQTVAEIRGLNAFEKNLSDTVTIATGPGACTLAGEVASNEHRIYAQAWNLLGLLTPIIFQTCEQLSKPEEIISCFPSFACIRRLANSTWRAACTFCWTFNDRTIAHVDPRTIPLVLRWTEAHEIWTPMKRKAKVGPKKRQPKRGAVADVVVPNAMEDMGRDEQEPDESNNSMPEGSMEATMLISRMPSVTLRFIGMEFWVRWLMNCAIDHNPKTPLRKRQVAQRRAASKRLQWRQSAEHERSRNRVSVRHLAKIQQGCKGLTAMLPRSTSAGMPPRVAYSRLCAGTRSMKGAW